MLNGSINRIQFRQICRCVGELKPHLENAILTERACIFVLSQRMCAAMSSVERDMCERPLLYSEIDLFRFYEKLKISHTLNAEKIEIAEKSMKRFGIGPGRSAAIIRYAQFNGRAIEIWMATVSASIDIDLQSDVQRIWKLLRSSDQLTLEATQYLGDLVELAEVIGDLTETSQHYETGRSGPFLFGGDDSNTVIPMI